jgi:2-amino-4-hydroxy-6-hydroxymethyldihydropteridine diphosphokinase
LRQPARKEAGIALGSNLGDPAKNVASALARLAQIPGVALERSSSLYRSEPWGRRDQPEFVNAAAIVSTTLSARELLDRLQDEEQAAGRRDGGKWGPRALDLDLLWYANEVSPDPHLTLPHPEIARRTFVLMPLAEIAPKWRHPVTSSTAQEMLAALERSGDATRCVVLAQAEGNAR